LDVKAKKEFCAAVDVGGTKISGALLTSEAQMFLKNKIAIDKTKSNAPVQQIVELIQAIKSSAHSEGGDIRAVGIAIPGVVYHNSGQVWAPNIPGWDHFPLRERLEEWTSFPLAIESDRSAYVLGEAWCGSAKGRKNVVFLAVGTGIGAGIIIDGHLCHGYEDIAGAVGWFALAPEFKQEYTEMGCFEAEASGNSLSRKAIQEIKDGKFSLMQEMVGNNIDSITAEIVVEAAKRDDSLAKTLIESAIRFLSMGIANIVSILNPEIVVLGGGLFQAGQFLVEPIRNEFKKWAQPLAARQVRLVLSELGEDAGLYGAGKLAWKHWEDIRQNSE
jgi:glucokinase